MASSKQRERRGAIAWLLSGLAATALATAPAMSASHEASRQDGLIPFDNSPFPVRADSIVPEKNKPFFDGEDGGGRFHVSPRGGKYYEARTYNDPNSLVVVPPRFDRRRPAALVVFFHGNLATLSRDVVRRQRVVAQLEASGLNALLVAPQLAVDALDSSPGRFYEPGFLDAYLDEAARHLAERSRKSFDAAFVRGLPVILVAYSGGYLATAFCVHDASASRGRIRGVLLLDALFGEERKFADWIAARERAFFVSAYSQASAGPNAALAADLAERGVTIRHELPATLEPGDVVLRPALGAVHNDFVTLAWTRDPLRALLHSVRLDDLR